MSKYEVYVKGITGDTKTIQLSNNNMITVYDLKKLINSDEPYMVRLLYNGTEVGDEQFLNQINTDTFYYLMKLNKEVEILLEIKRKMNIRLNWSRDIDLSEWQRIEISSDSGSKFKVTKLDLSWLQLTGEIPKEIGKLTNLQELSLYVNQLTGEIPKDIGKLINLQRLNLFNNQLTGEIPKEIGKLMNLQVFYYDKDKLIEKK